MLPRVTVVVQTVSWARSLSGLEGMREACLLSTVRKSLPFSSFYLCFIHHSFDSYFIKRIIIHLWVCFVISFLIEFIGVSLANKIM